MPFQLVLTKFFKSELFSCLPKIDHVIKSCRACCGLFLILIKNATWNNAIFNWGVFVLSNCWNKLKNTSICTALRNRACRNASLVNANFSVNQMCPIICRWKLVEHRYCFGHNRRAKDNRKIKVYMTEIFLFAW